MVKELKQIFQFISQKILMNNYKKDKIIIKHLIRFLYLRNL